jgi:hypothetical protein
MTKKKLSIFGTAAAALLALGATRPADACFQCTSSQWCTSGSLGGSCTVYSEGGRQWCQHTLDCDIQITMTPLQVSPAGTYLAKGGEQVTEEGVEKQKCNGFITSHVASASAATVNATTIRI